MTARAEAVSVSPETMIPDLLKDYPQARAVLDKYGLKGCGGPMGPHESLGLFARAHEVDLEALLAEIKEALTAKETVQRDISPSLQAVPPPVQPDIADTIYRRYFLAGITVILTLGASWGAFLLWRIGMGASFAGVPVQEINAHAQAQVFGWMGFFIMGFACQAFPRFWHTSLQKPALAVLSFYLMAAGVVSASLGITIGNHSPYAVAAAVGGSALELAALSIFAAQMYITFKHSGRALEPYIAFVFTAISWFIASTAFNAWHVFNLMTATNAQEMQNLVTTYQWPLRDMQFHGLGMTIIFGVSLRTLPHLFGLPKVSDRRAWTTLTILTAAVVAEIALYLAFRIEHKPLYESLLLIPWTGLFSAALILTLPWKLWRPFPEKDRSAKFIRLGYLWLFISLVMLLLSPAYEAASHLQLSHAYFGAIRHAITVGFISLMIMAYSAKVVPTLNGIDKSKLSQLWGPFLLVNTGCFLRVALQIGTDWNHSVFNLIGLSGTLEVAGLTWWGLHLAGIIIRGRSEMKKLLSGAASTPVSERPAEILPEHMVGDVLDWYPQTEPVFIAFGFAAVTNPVMRATLAKQVPIKRACMMHAVSESDFVQALNDAASGKTPSTSAGASGCSHPCGGSHSPTV